MNIDEFGNTLKIMCSGNVVEFALNGKRDKDGNISITSLSVVEKNEDQKHPVGFRNGEK